VENDLLPNKQVIQKAREERRLRIRKRVNAVLNR
jgi:hypothetical protein